MVFTSLGDTIVDSSHSFFKMRCRAGYESGSRQLAILDSQTGTAVAGNDAVKDYLRSVTGARVQFIYRYQP